MLKVIQSCIQKKISSLSTGVPWLTLNKPGQEAKQLYCPQILEQAVSSLCLQQAQKKKHKNHDYKH